VALYDLRACPGSARPAGPSRQAARRSHRSAARAQAARRAADRRRTPAARGPPAPAHRRRGGGPQQHRPLLGTERLVEFTSRHEAAGRPTAETLRRLNHAILDHQDGPLQDDATTVMIEWLSDQPDRSTPATTPIPPSAVGVSACTDDRNDATPEAPGQPAQRHAAKGDGPGYAVSPCRTASRCLVRHGARAGGSQTVECMQVPAQRVDRPSALVHEARAVVDQQANSRGRVVEPRSGQVRFSWWRRGRRRARRWGSGLP
jgi:hypothetical protein